METGVCRQHYSMNNRLINLLIYMILTTGGSGSGGGTEGSGWRWAGRAGGRITHYILVRSLGANRACPTVRVITLVAN